MDEQTTMAKTDTAPIFTVSIDAKRVTLRKIEQGRPGYRKARKDIIFRQRDAIELYQRLKAAGKGFDGVYSFQFLDTAKTFAMLRLESLEHMILDNLDQIQVYDGSAKSSDS
jgi:hypothetical protein